jgi:hypothetical protein
MLLGVEQTSQIEFAMSGFDPKRTFAAAASRSRKLVEEEINGGNPAVPGDDEIGSLIGGVAAEPFQSRHAFAILLVRAAVSEG